jgi:hypothetical protein
MSPPLALVVGCPRSGTTWLAAMLHTHPGIAGVAGGETNLFIALTDLHDNLTSPSGEGLARYVSTEQGYAAMRRFCDRLIEAKVAEAHQPVELFLEKTPGHGARLSWISTVYPDVRAIHIIRDGRDVSRSLTRVDFGASSIAEAARGWSDLVGFIEANRASVAKSRVVRYEELLVRPVDGVMELMEWLGLRVDDATRDRLRAAAEVPVSRYGDTDAVGAGKWRTMPARDLDDIYAGAGQRLVEYGYLTSDELATWSRSWRGRAARARRRLSRRRASVS